MIEATELENSIGNNWAALTGQVTDDYVELFHDGTTTLSLADALIQTAKDLGIRDPDNNNASLWAEGSTWTNLGGLVGLEYGDYYKVVRHVV